MTARTRSIRPLPVLSAGAGPPLVLLGGFALAPTAYRPTVEALSRSWSVTVPDLFPLRPLREAWSAERICARLRAALDARRLDGITLVSHSFGTALALQVVARDPGRFEALVVASSSGLSERLGMLSSASVGFRVLGAASPGAVWAFARNALAQPISLLRAGSWAFFRDADETLRRVAASGVPVHVLWAADDSFVRRVDGERFAAKMGASFHVASDPSRARPVDHGWVYRHPALFERTLAAALAASAPDRLPSSTKSGARPVPAASLGAAGRNGSC